MLNYYVILCITSSTNGSSCPMTLQIVSVLEEKRSEVNPCPIIPTRKRAKPTVVAVLERDTKTEQKKANDTIDKPNKKKRATYKP